MDVIDYSTILDKLHFQGNFMVMVNFDLDDAMTLKPSIFWLAIQGLLCILITASIHSSIGYIVQINIIEEKL